MTAEFVPGVALNATPESVLRRLRNLLKLADDTSSPRDAENAAFAAANLMRKYDLSRAALQAAACLGGATVQSPGVVARIIYMCRMRQPAWVKPIISAVTVAQHCHTTVVQVDDEHGRFHHTEFVCFGTAEDTGIVCEIITMILEQVNQLARLYLGGNRNSFRVGCALAIKERIEAATRSANEEVRSALIAQLPPGRADIVMSGALAVLDRRREDAVEEAMKAAGIDERTPASTRVRVRDENGFADGYLAGRRVKIQLADELRQAGR